jgi:hypothetical protein
VAHAVPSRDRARDALPELVRATSAAVVERARWVRLDPGGIDLLAAALAAEGPPASRPGPWDVAGSDAAPERLAALVLALAAVNFGSGWHPVLRKRPGMSGATTVAAGVRAWEADTGPLRAAQLVALRPADVAAIADQPADDPELAPLVGHWTAALVELGAHVAAHHGGSFLQVVASAEGSAARLVGELDRLPHFHDVATHQGEPVVFLKRAQLAAADLARALPDHPATRFDDLHRLTAFADNLVPHVLRVEGALRLEPDLAARIERGELLEAGGAEEVEIRAAGVQGVELLVAALARSGTVVTASDLDAWLWARGAGARFKAVPRHRTRCTAY